MKWIRITWLACTLAASRRRRKGRALVFAAVVAAVGGTAAALAANSNNYLDKTGDAGLAPDIRAVTVSSDDAGNIRVAITADRQLLLSLPNEEFIVGIDSDQNPDTGTIFYGADYGLDLNGIKAGILVPGPDGFFHDAPGTIGVDVQGNVLTFTVKASDIGLSATSGFNFWVVTATDLGGDAAPDIRTFNYQQVAGTVPPALGPDTRAPYDEAYKATGKRGKTAYLYYRAADGRGMTADVIRVYRGEKVLKTISYKLENTVPFSTYHANWKVPKKMKGRLRFCVQSTDAVGNRSNVACAALTIK